MKLKKKIYNKHHIEYELINLSESANNQLKKLHKELEISLDEFNGFYDQTKQTKIGYHHRIRTTIHFIHIVQSIEGIMRLLSFYPTFKKDKMFSQITRKINDYWYFIMEFITQQSEEQFLNEILANIRITQINSENVN